MIKILILFQFLFLHQHFTVFKAWRTPRLNCVSCHKQHTWQNPLDFFSKAFWMKLVVRQNKRVPEKWPFKTGFQVKANDDINHRDGWAEEKNSVSLFVLFYRCSRLLFNHWSPCSSHHLHSHLNPSALISSVDNSSGDEPSVLIVLLMFIHPCTTIMNMGISNSVLNFFYFF